MGSMATCSNVFVFGSTVSGEELHGSKAPQRGIEPRSSA